MQWHNLDSLFQFDYLTVPAAFVFLSILIHLVFIIYYWKKN